MESKSYPFNQLPTFSQSPITSVDQRGPPTALLVSCRYLCDELCTYFYSKVTLGFVARARPWIRDRNIDPISLGVIHRVKKINVRMTWHSYMMEPGIDSITLPYSMNGWLAELVDLLLDTATNLQVITLTVADEMLESANWELKEWTLAPLKKIADRVRFQLGDVTATDEDEAELKERLVAYLKELNEVALPAVGS
jgi:hypothetical protein